MWARYATYVKYVKHVKCVKCVPSGGQALPVGGEPLHLVECDRQRDPLLLDSARTGPARRHQLLVPPRQDRQDRLRHPARRRLRHIGIGRTHARTHAILIVQDLHVRVVDAATGELLRELLIDPRKDYQPRGLPPGPAPKKK